MGYTHYWYRAAKIDKVAWGHVVGDVRRVLAKLPKEIELAGALGVGAPALTGETISFNGAVPGNYESFHVKRVMNPSDQQGEDGMFFAFCKTAEKPYDLAVTAALVVLKRHLKDAIKVSSDGGDVDWKAAKILCQETLGYGREMAFNKDGQLGPFAPESAAKEKKAEIQA